MGSLGGSPRGAGAGGRDFRRVAGGGSDANVEIIRLLFAYTVPMRRIYMSFMQRQGWHCQFLEEDLKTALPKKLAFLSQDMILQLARRGGAVLNLETEQAIRHGIDIGRGGVWLNLSDEQYRKLK